MTNPSPQTNADLVRLDHDDWSQVSETLTSLLERGEALDKVAGIIERKIDNGIPVVPDQLAALIGQTGSESLYAKTRQQLFTNDSALVRLYRSGYPDPDIEKTLCTRLYKYATDDGQPWRRYIIDAMRDVGSEIVLPTLEAILYDHAPSLKAKQMIVQAIESAGVISGEAMLTKFETRSRAAFITSVAEAIAAIKERGNASEAKVSAMRSHALPGQEEQEEIEEKDELYSALAEREQARGYLEKDDPLGAVWRLRRGAEAIGKHLYRFLGHEQGGKPARKMTLEELLLPVGNSDAPEVFKHCLQTLQRFGNFASHDQDEQGKYLTRSIAEPLLKLYDEALRMYRDWLHEKKSSEER